MFKYTSQELKTNHNLIPDSNAKVSRSKNIFNNVKGITNFQNYFFKLIQYF